MLPDGAWTTWSVDWSAVVPLLGWTVLYLRGAGLRTRAGRGQPRRTAAFLSGAAAVVVAVAGPIPVLSGQLLWVHMVQHLLLVLVAAPLLALGSPVATVRLALPPGPRHGLAVGARATRRARRRLGGLPPLVLATVAHIVALWVWHAPPLYDLAVRNDVVHAFEHAAFLLTGVWVWAEVVATARRNRRLQALVTLCLGALIAQGGVMGALLTFAGRSLFDVYTGAGTLTALEDQEFAGVLMWVPPGFVYGTVAVRRFISWIETGERELAAREARELAHRDRRSAARARAQHVEERRTDDGQGERNHGQLTVRPREPFGHHPRDAGHRDRYPDHGPPR